MARSSGMRAAHGARPCGCAAMLALLVLLASGCGPAIRSDEAILVFAASSLTDAVEAAIDSFRVSPDGVPVIVDVGASSILARQIEHGAGADVFLAAHPEWMHYLEERGLVESPLRLPITSRLVMVYPPPAEGGRAPDVAALPRLVLADPEHVPAGIYAREMLTCSGDWKEVESRLVPVADARAALAAVDQGAAAAAIVYASDALHASHLASFPLEPARCQPEIRYLAAVTTGTRRKAAARRFIEFLSGSSAVALWSANGFEVDSLK